MEDLTLALITLTSFVLLFVVAIFADRAGLDGVDEISTPERMPLPVEESPVLKPARRSHDARVDVA